LRTYSFLATLAIIGVIVGASYVSSLPKVEHLPDTIQFYAQPWMAYVPAETYYVGYVSYEDAIDASGNSTLFGTGPLLELAQLLFDFYPHDVVYEVDIELPTPDYSGTVTLLRVSLDQLNGLAVRLSNSTKIPSRNYHGFEIYSLLMSKPGYQKPQLGYLTIFNGYVLFSDDQSTGKQNVERIIDQAPENTPDLFDNEAVRRSVYASGVRDQPYIGLYVGMFPSQLNNTKMIVKSVIQQGNRIAVTRAVLFPNTDSALGQFGEAHRIYRDASSYRILDSWLVIAYQYSMGKLRGELIGI